MSLTKTGRLQQADQQNKARARARSEISFASRVVNQDRPLDWEDREAIARALHLALCSLEICEQDSKSGAFIATS